MSSEHDSGFDVDGRGHRWAVERWLRANGYDPERATLEQVCAALNATDPENTYHVLRDGTLGFALQKSADARIVPCADKGATYPRGKV